MAWMFLKKSMMVHGNARAQAEHSMQPFLQDFDPYQQLFRAQESALLLCKSVWSTCVIIIDLVHLQCRGEGAFSIFLCNKKIVNSCNIIRLQ